MILRIMTVGRASGVPETPPIIFNWLGGKMGARLRMLQSHRCGFRSRMGTVSLLSRFYFGKPSDLRHLMGTVSLLSLFSAAPGVF
jgi:hypothetical protein